MTVTVLRPSARTSRCSKAWSRSTTRRASPGERVAEGSPKTTVERDSNVGRARFLFGMQLMVVVLLTLLTDVLTVVEYTVVAFKETVVVPPVPDVTMVVLETVAALGLVVLVT